MSVLCIGKSSLETTCVIDKPINLDSINTINEKYVNGGGKIGNVAYLLGKWGIDTYIACAIGSDEAGTKIKKDLENVNVKCEYIETNYDAETNRSIILLNKVTKDKTVLDIQSNSYLKKYTFSSEPDLIVIDGNDYNASLSTLDKYPKALSIYCPYKATKEMVEYGKYVKYVILNKRICEEASGLKINFEEPNSLVNMYNFFKQRFNSSELMITLGERGVLYAINGQVKIMPTISLEVNDPSGAGDVFAGAFAYGLMKQFDLEKTITFANIAASLSTAKMTSRESIPTLTEVSNFYDSKFGSQNNNVNNTNTVDNKEPVTNNQNVSTPNDNGVTNDNAQNA